ncbi:MAG: DUF4838 domain-containing protein [Planctomycetes bacterium]|nr:DUF4838 domain-containing protein [Planctomycetota bacterium]
MMQKKAVTIILFILVLTGNIFAKQITIINPKKASITEKFAAAELQKYLGKITGENFDIKNSKWYTKFTITVANQANYKIKKLSLAREEYVIKSVKNGLVLSGGGDRGSLYAVYDFLEKLGCRWYYMDPEDEIVPTLTVSEVVEKAGDLDFVEKPDFKVRMRRFITYDLGPAGNAVAKKIMSKEQMTNRTSWMIKNRINIFQYGIDHNKDCYTNWYGYKAVFDEMKKRDLVIGAGGHMFFKFMPPDTFDKHPEWFALIDGKRVEKSQFCTSDKDAVNFYINNMLEFLEENPEIEYFAPWPSDMANFCQCEKCKGKSFSDRYLELSNMVYNKLKEKAPNVTYTHFPYHFYKQPPEKVGPEKGMNITLNTWGRNLAYPFYDKNNSEEFRNVFQAWKKITSEYNCTFLLHEKYLRHLGMHYHPLPYAILKDELSWFKQQGLDGFELPMGYMGRRTKSLNFYVTCKLLWDSEADVDLIVRDFFEKCYGQNAGLMKKAYEAIVAGQPNLQYFDRCNDLGWRCKTLQTLYPVSLLDYAENAERHFQLAMDYSKQALKNESDEKVKTRISKFIKTADYAREQWQACSYLCQTCKHDSNLKSVDNAEDYQAELDLMKKNLLKAKKLSDKRNKTAKDNPACGLYWDALWSSCHGIYYDSHIANWLKEVERKRKIDFDSLVRTKVLQDN